MFNCDVFRIPRFDTCRGGPYHARAMGNALRDRRTPADLATAGQVIEIAEKIGTFRRLAAAVEHDLGALPAATLPSEWRDAAVTGRLSFGFADAHERLPMLEGRVSVTTDAVCQRCLEPFKLPVTAELRLLFPGEGGASAAAEGLEVWELDEPTLQPLDLVDEALIMAMPLAPMHADRALCKVAAEGPVREAAPSRPFAGLRDEMRRKN